eukprot:330271-Hanusia_phi.AAC.1
MARLTSTLPLEDIVVHFLDNMLVDDIQAEASLELSPIRDDIETERTEIDAELTKRSLLEWKKLV